MYKRRLAVENDLVTSHDRLNPLPKLCTNSKKVIGAN